MLSCNSWNVITPMILNNSSAVVANVKSETTDSPRSTNNPNKSESSSHYFNQGNNNNSPKECVHCGRLGHTIDYRWIKYPHKRPQRFFLVSTQQSKFSLDVSDRQTEIISMNIFTI